MISNSDKLKILLIDDDASFLGAAEIILKKKFDIYTSTSIAQAVNVISRVSIDICVTDLNFVGHDADGLDLLDWLSEHHPLIPLVVLSGDSNTKRVVEAMRRNLIDFITKDEGWDEHLKSTLQRAIEVRKKLTKSDGTIEIQTRSPKVVEILRKIDRVIASGSNCPILILGETGVGKEVISKYIAHRTGKKLVAANMASIPKETAESLLFGHVKGSFTSANANQIGLIEQAHNGIFFLDELGECPPEVQTKLLRTLQESEILPVGGTARKINVRFVAATNSNLQAMIARGQFRLDLFQRLNTVTFEIPPLRERPEDVEYLAGRFLQEFSNGKTFSLRPEGLVALLEHTWPGNIRELRSTLERLCIFEQSSIIDAAAVNRALLSSGTNQSPATLKLNSRHMNMMKEILQALDENHGNRTATAASLGLHPSNLYRWMNKLGINTMVAGQKGSYPVNTAQFEWSGIR